MITPSTASRRAWGEDVRATLRLSWPLALSQLGLFLLGFVDTYLAGKVDQQTLAAISLGNTVFYAAAVFGQGLLLGLDAVASQALGARRDRAGRRALWQGVYLAVAISVPLILAMYVVAWALPSFGVVEPLVRGTRDYISGRAFSLAPFLILGACRSYLQAAHLARPVIVSTVLANLINATSDVLVLFGDDALAAVGLPAVGLPRLGAFGLGLASSGASLTQCLFLAWAVRWVEVRPGPRSLRRFDIDLVRRIVSVGAPVGLQLFAEVFIFSFTGVLMGGISVYAAAAHQVALIYASLSFALCVGIGAAAAVLVGRAVGAGDTAGARRAGFVSLGLSVAVMSTSATIMIVFGETLSKFIIDDAEVVPLAGQLLRVAAVFQLVDGVQAVAAGALRGAGVTRFSLVSNLVGHWAIGIPVGLALGFSAGLGPVGLWWGLTTGLAAVAVALTFKFVVLTRRPIESVVGGLVDD
ncbi:MAG: MATE family efflux transporter [Myxococcota bacterium]